MKKQKLNECKSSKEKLKKKKQKPEIRGITLIALVVTIVVLLILTGITINFIMNGNSVLNQAQDARVQNTLGEIQDQAGIIYSDEMIKSVKDGLNGTVETAKVIERLRNQGYSIKEKPVSEGDIEGIKLDKENITMGTKKEAELNVTYIGAEDPFVYYAEVEGNYYKMTSNKGAITLEREASGLTASDFEIEEGTINPTLTITSNSTGIVTANLKTGSNKIIEIKSTETEGETTITVTYGSYTKECKVKTVAPILATNITLNVTSYVVTGGESWTNDLQLKATLEPSNVTEKEVTWKSNNPEIATVDSSGLVKAGTKGGDVTITATTKDGTKLSAECKIITELFGAVKGSRTSYTDSNGNEVQIPEGYAVGTSDNVNKVAGGLVIQDDLGNQFVWVPVNDTQYAKMIDETNHRGNLYNFTTSGTTPITYSANGFREPDSLTDSTHGDNNSSSYFTNAGIKDKGGNDITNAETFKALLQSEFNSMAASVKSYKGFYIGRYETGNLEAVKNSTPVVQRGNTKIGSANWYYQYANSKNIAKNDKVTSSMIWECQWDRALEWIVTTNGNNWSLVTDSRSWGNYNDSTGDAARGKGTKKSTGYNEAWKKNNIYDMAGNVWDWTLGATGTEFRVARRRPVQLFWFRSSSLFSGHHGSPVGTDSSTSSRSTLLMNP